MFDAVLHVSGGAYDVPALLERYDLNHHADLFLQGEPDLFGNPNVESGFDLLIAEGILGADSVNEIRLFLEHKAPLLDALFNAGAQCVLDIACAVSNDDQPAPTMALPVDVLGLCFSRHVAIEFSVYPATADEF